jgi:hypothetical protein
MAETMLLSRLYWEAAKVVAPVLIIDFAADTFVTDPTLNSMMSLLLALLMVFGALVVMVRLGMRTDREVNPHRYAAPLDPHAPSRWSRLIDAIFTGFAKQAPVLSYPGAKLMQLLLTVHVPLIFGCLVGEEFAGPGLDYWFDWWFVICAVLFTVLFVRASEN